MFLNKQTILRVFYGFFLISLAYHMLRQIYAGYTVECWQLTDMLINYQGGFVRRGLLGDLILWLYHAFDLHPYWVVLSISFLCYVILGFFFLYHFVKKGYTLFFFPFVFFFGNPILNDFWVRKDCLLLLVFIGVIYFFTQGGKWKMIPVTILSVLGLLIHEALAFFLIPILALLLWKEEKKNAKYQVLHLILNLLPILGTLCIIALFSGNWDTSGQIWDSWKGISFPVEPDVKHKIPAAIDAVSWPFSRTVELVWENVFYNFRHHIYAPLAWLAIIFTTFWILSNTEKVKFTLFGSGQNEINKSRISNFLIFQWIALIPLFTIGADYGRWIFYWTTSSFALFILVPAEKADALFPKFITQLRMKITHLGNSIFGNTSILFLSFLIGHNGYIFDIYKSLENSALVVILQNISKIIFYLFGFVLG
jgi:hypothetical protein